MIGSQALAGCVGRDDAATKGDIVGALHEALGQASPETADIGVKVGSLLRQEQLKLDLSNTWSNGLEMFRFVFGWLTFCNFAPQHKSPCANGEQRAIDPVEATKTALTHYGLRQGVVAFLSKPV